MTPSRTWCGLSPVQTVGATIASARASAGRAQRHRLDEQGVGADGQVLAVLLERADREDADRTRLSRAPPLRPGTAR